MPDAVLVVDGPRVECVHDDDLAAALRAAGFDLATRRAGSVEPDPSGWWVVDVSPLTGAAGPEVLGHFRHRDDALAIEREWVSDWLTRPGR
jgi:hypothetical protein